MLKHLQENTSTGALSESHYTVAAYSVCELPLEFFDFADYVGTLFMNKVAPHFSYPPNTMHTGQS